MLNKYIQDYSENFIFEPAESFSYEICGISVKIDVWDYNSSTDYREKAYIRLQKGNLKYECECIDRHAWDDMFYPLNLNGKTYLCFRKTLYGFTFLDAETLVEEYDYFPEEVIGGHESFIIVDAKMLGDIIIFDGCYWACPYSCVAYDFRSGLFVNLSLEYGIGSADSESEIKDGALILHGADGAYNKTVTHSDISRLLKEKGNTDF